MFSQHFNPPKEQQQHPDHPDKLLELPPISTSHDPSSRNSPGVSLPSIIDSTSSSSTTSRSLSSQSNSKSDDCTVVSPSLVEKNHQSHDQLPSPAATTDDSNKPASSDNSSDITSVTASSAPPSPPPDALTPLPTLVTPQNHKLIHKQQRQKRPQAASTTPKSTSSAPKKQQQKLPSSPSANPVVTPTEKIKKYKCCYCDRAFSRSEHRSRHERSHTKERPFHCPKCPSTFVRRDLLLRHDRTVHAKTQKPPSSASSTATTTTKAKASKATQAQSRVKRLEKMQPVATTIEERVAPFTLPSPERPLPPPLIRLEKANVGYEPGKPILKNLNLRMDLDDRIGLLGVNGAGKSTFAKLIAKALTIETGEFHRDGKMRVGWFHQHQIEAMDPTDTPLEIIRRAMPDASESSRRSRLAQFGLPFEKQETTVGSLSGGERARLLLNLVAMDAPHILILDEPTNHLDIDSRRALLDALNEYTGAVILITHDRSLMELVADRLWLAADGSVKPFDGDMDDYQKFVLDRAKQAGMKPSQVKHEEADKATNSPQATSARGASDRTTKKGPSPSTLRHAVKKAEDRMTQLTADLARLDDDLANAAVNDPKKLEGLTRARAKAQTDLDQAEADWIAAEEALAEVA